MSEFYQLQLFPKPDTSKHPNIHTPTHLVKLQDSSLICK